VCACVRACVCARARACVARARACACARARLKFGTQVPTNSTSKLCSSATWPQHDIFFVVMFVHFPLALYQSLHSTLASPNFQYPCHTTPFHLPVT